MGAGFILIRSLVADYLKNSNRQQVKNYTRDGFFIFYKLLKDMYRIPALKYKT
jgi:hypothetical protein